MMMYTVKEIVRSIMVLVCLGGVVGATLVDIPWPATTNVFIAHYGDTIRFHWSGLHNVLQVATFTGQVSPLSPFADAGWPNQIKSGPKQNNSEFTWDTTNYRPGIYFFVDENNPQGGIVSVTNTDFNGTRYAKRPCTALSTMYGGRYANYSQRPNCSLVEVNNFQTEAHFDWVQPIFTVTQGDLIIFRWTGEHNVVQVHDVEKDSLVPGGIYSGPKNNCVGGPQFECINTLSGGKVPGEYLIDTYNYRPGIIHMSDECAYTCTGHTTGMNMEFDLRFGYYVPTPEVGGGCKYNSSKVASSRLIQMYNQNEGAQFDYNVPVGVKDIVRFTWAGSLKIVQTLPTSSSNTVPSKNAKPGGIYMKNFVNCTPGPNLSCLEGTELSAQLVFDVEVELARGNYEQDQYYNRWFSFYAYGENTPGFTSSDSGVILYIDNSVTYGNGNCTNSAPLLTAPKLTYTGDDVKSSGSPALFASFSLLSILLIAVNKLVFK